MQRGVGAWTSYLMACFAVHSFAVLSYLARSFSKILAMSGTSGSFGFGSHNSEQIDKSTFEIVRAGDHWLFKMSRQIPPFGAMFYKANVEPKITTPNHRIRLQQTQKTNVMVR